MQTDIQIINYMDVEEFFYQKDENMESHCSLWSDFNFSLNGTLEFFIAGKCYLSPPSYGIWIPSQIEHGSTAVADQPTHYVCIRIHPSLCSNISKLPKTLSIKPFFRYAVKECLEQKKLNIPNPQYFAHLLQIILDQIESMPCHDHYLPQSAHPILKPLLAALSDPFLFEKSLQQIIENFALSERHVLRLCQQELQLSISEWRNRAKIVYAISQIQQGSSIKKVSLDLGYQHSSSFIEFFKRYTGQTPSQIKSA